MKNNKQKLNLFTFLMLLFFANGFAQIVQKFGDDSFTIDPNAVLELQSTNKGLLLPRVLLEGTTLRAPLSAGTTLVAGYTVYNTNTITDVTPGFYYWNGAKWVRVADSSSTIAVANGGTGATTAAGALTNLGAQSTSNLSSNVATNTGSTTMYPSVSAVETYVAAQATANATPDASTTVKGKIQLAGDLAGTADLPVVAANAITSAKILDGVIVNADISATAAIADTKLATIATAGKVSNSATTATAVNTVSTIVLRDASGNFSAGAITATGFSGNGSGLTNVTSTTNANLTGPITSVGNVTSVASQTGTGTKFVMDTSPTLVTPILGAATGTSLSVSGQLTSTVATGTAPLVVTSTTPVANLSIGGNAATVTTNANLTGVVTSSGNATAIADGALSIAKTSGLQTAIDAKVADAINDATTTIAPSQNAVFDALALKATIAAPTFTGDAKAVTPTAGDSDTSIATTAFVAAAVTTAVNSLSVVTKTANYTATTTDSTILYETASAADVEGFTLTIPAAAAGNSGKVYVIKKVDTSANKLKFSLNLYLTSAVTISSLNYAKTFRIQSDGTRWNIID